MIEMSNNICLAMSYIWCFKPDVTFSQMIKTLGVAIEKGYISESGFVNNADALIFLVSGKNVKVLHSLQNNGRVCIANFAFNGHNHWVVVDANDNIIYNPLEHSVCVEKGKIVEYRIW